jgi:hypothetical protein
MQTIRVIGRVDGDGQLIASVPASIAPGEVEVVVIAPTPSEDDAGNNWLAGIAREWHDDLADPQQDIYTLADGAPADDAR